jgi:hypothetical protein
MAGDYPSTDFAISEEGQVRRVVHLPTGMVIETAQVPGKPTAVTSRAFKTEVGEYSADVYADEIAQAALRHLRVWLMRSYGKGRRGNP